MNEKRGSWYLLTGLVLGLVLGLLYAWVLRPVEYTNTSPASLSPAYKDKYRALIAAAYMANGDLVRAQGRLALLDDPDTYATLAQQAQRALADGSSPQEARALGMLSVALGQGSGPSPNPITNSAGTPTLTPAALQQGTPSPSAQIGSAVAITSTTALKATVTELNQVTQPTTEKPAVTVSATATLLPQDTLTPTLQITRLPSVTPTQTPTRTPTFVPLPTRTMTPTPSAPFVLDTRETVCDPNLGEPQIQVETFDQQGQPVPGVEIVVNWQGGEEHFYTGLKPELGLGYADFTMTPDISYNLRLAEGGQPITDLTAPECALSSGERYWGAWRLTFVQP